MRLTGIAPLIARMRLVVFVALMMFASIAATNEFRLPEDRIEAFLELLPGFWQGEAIETPVGSMAYDMLFHSCGDGTLAGVAKTGASLHYWQFSHRDKNLSIRFLSTFGGNRTPVFLIPDAPDGTILNFFAPQRKILTLGITVSEIQLDIRVFHHNKPHVHIRLTRSYSPPVEHLPHHSYINSCRESATE